jgi:hypothetical protein
MYAFLHLTPGPEWPQRQNFILQTRHQATVVSQLGTVTPLLTLDTWQKWFPNWALMPGSQITLRHLFFLSGFNTKPKLQKKKHSYQLNENCDLKTRTLAPKTHIFA